MKCAHGMTVKLVARSLYNLPVALMFSQVMSMETVQHFIALLSTTDSFTDPSDSFTLIVDWVKATVISTKIHCNYMLM